MRQFPDFSFEKKYWDQNFLVIGVDEVGRGALAGPITVGAVCINPHDCEKWEPLRIHDSKKLTAKKREELSPLIKQYSLAYSIASSNVEIINSDGIVNAFKKAVKETVQNILNQLNAKQKPFLLIDAFCVDNIPEIDLHHQEGIIKGDNKSISIAAASIIAKVERDNMMNNFDNEFPHYGWSENKGYGTQKHRDGIKIYGPNMHHRDLYIRNVIGTI